MAYWTMGAKMKTKTMRLVTYSGNPRRYSLKTFRTSFVVEEGPEDPHVKNSDEAAWVAKAIFETLDANQEHFIVLALNTKNAVFGYKVLFSGGMAISIVDIKLVMTAALKLEAAAFIVAHNHPSGDPTPSREDMDITHRLFAAGKLLSIKFLDHVIIGENHTYSFADNGRIEA